MWVNVKTAFGAVGDGSTDDRAALQAALDSGWPLYFPPGDYKINDSLLWTKSVTIRGHVARGGGSGSRIVGTFDKPLIHNAGCYVSWDNQVVGSTSGLPMLALNVEDMTFINGHLQGTCVQAVFGVTPTSFIRCGFNTSYRGLMFMTCFGVLVANCHFTGPSAALDSHISGGTEDQAFGLLLNQHSTAVGCDFQGIGTGVYMNATQNAIYGARVEVCGYGLIVGGPTLDIGFINQNWTCERSVVSAISMESNRRNVWARAAGTVTFDQLGLHGGTNGPPAHQTKGDYGIRIDKGGASFKNVHVFGNFLQAAVVINARANCDGITAANFESGRPAFAGGNTLFSLSADTNDRARFRLIGVPLNPSINVEQPIDSRSITSFSDLQLLGLKGLNIRDLNVLPKNLGGIEPVTEGATTRAIIFPTGATISQAQFSGASLTVENDATSTLAAGTYYYATTLIGTRGETGVPRTGLSSLVYRSATVGSEQRVKIDWFGVGDTNVRRRLYRGPAEFGVFEGFWEFANTVNTFTDDGKTAFTGKDIPAASDYAVPTRVEEDANYAVIVTPSWGTTAWVTNKATTGFTIEFGTAAPAGATVQWLLFRP